MLEDVRVIAPTIFVAPPRIWNGMYDMSRPMVSSLVQSGVTEEEAERQVSERFVQMLGGRVIVTATGGAPSNEKVVNWVRKTMPMASFMNSYGATGLLLCSFAITVHLTIVLCAGQNVVVLLATV